MQVPVRSEEEVGALVARGMEGKTMGANYRHEHSSRSHTVVRLVVQAHHQSDSQLKGVTCVAVAAAAAMVLSWSCHPPRRAHDDGQRAATAGAIWDDGHHL